MNAYSPGDEPAPLYRLITRLGIGSRGEVWRCRDPEGLEVALKIIPLGEVPTGHPLASLPWLRKLRHPNLLTPNGFWFRIEPQALLDAAVSGEPFLLDAPAREMCVVMDLADRSLAARLNELKRQGKPGIPPRELLSYFEDAATAIDYLNEGRFDLEASAPTPVYHCNLKPTNLLLFQGKVKVADVGTARLVDGSTTAEGTPAYLAPEMCENPPQPQPGTDQYSLALTYVELRTGEPPVSARTEFEAIRKHQRGQIDFSKLSPLEANVIRRATSLKATDRYPTVREMVADLREALNPRDIQSKVSTVTPQRPARPEGPSIAEQMSQQISIPVPQPQATPIVTPPTTPLTDVPAELAESFHQKPTTSQPPDLPKLLGQVSPTGQVVEIKTALPIETRVTTAPLGESNFKGLKENASTEAFEQKQLGLQLAPAVAPPPPAVPVPPTGPGVTAAFTAPAADDDDNVPTQSHLEPAPGLLAREPIAPPPKLPIVKPTPGSVAGRGKPPGKGAAVPPLPNVPRAAKPLASSGEPDLRSSRTPSPPIPTPAPIVPPPPEIVPVRPVRTLPLPQAPAPDLQLSLSGDGAFPVGLAKTETAPPKSPDRLRPNAPLAESGKVSTPAPQSLIPPSTDSMEFVVASINAESPPLPSAPVGKAPSKGANLPPTVGRELTRETEGPDSVSEQRSDTSAFDLSSLPRQLGGRNSGALHGSGRSPLPESTVLPLRSNDLEPVPPFRVQIAHPVQVNPQRLEPLIVRLVPAGDRERLGHSMPAVLEIEPIIPGCLCTPATVTVACRDRQEAVAEFQLTPLAIGPLEPAAITVRRGPEVMLNIPLRIASVSGRWAGIWLLMALILPPLFGLYQGEFPAGKTDGFNLYRRLAGEVFGLLMPEVVLGACAAIALVWFVLTRPRRAETIAEYDSSAASGLSLGGGGSPFPSQPEIETSATGAIFIPGR